MINIITKKHKIHNGGIIVSINPIQDQPFQGYSWMREEGGGQKDLPSKICQTYPTMMKLGTVIPYLKKTQKIYESRNAPLEFC